jgi:tRNA(Ile)-lysidine synthase
MGTRRVQHPLPSPAAAELVARVQAAVGRPRAGIAVAFSGGLDSSVLLHLLVAAGIPRLRALHVNHGLHADAAHWAAFCAGRCASLGVPFTALEVRVGSPVGQGLEAAARIARYSALRGVLRRGELLATAHHADDQAETVLLNLLRGSGVTGLGGIPPRAPFGTGTLVRPLLDVARSALAAYAAAAGLAWLDDPMNHDDTLGRNYLRHEVLPLVEARWPGARATIGRGAALAAESARLVDALAELDARRAARAGRLAIAALRRLDEPRQRNLLRFICLRELGSAPPLERLRSGLAQLLTAAPDRQPLLAWPGGEVRRYRDELWVLPVTAPLPGVAGPLAARAGAAVGLGSAGTLALGRSRRGGLAVDQLPPTLRIAFRTGGERLRLPGARQRRDLGKLLQERGVVPWMRERIPLLYAGETLVAVADLWIAAEFAAPPGVAGLRVRWSDHPPLR